MAESALALPIEQMKTQAARVLKARDEPGSMTGPEDASDLACHILALAESLERACEAIAVAARHLDRFGIVEGDADELESQGEVFAASDPFTKTCGDKIVSLYAEVING